MKVRFYYNPLIDNKEYISSFYFVDIYADEGRRGITHLGYVMNKDPRKALKSTRHLIEYLSSNYKNLFFFRKRKLDEITDALLNVNLGLEPGDFGE